MNNILSHRKEEPERSVLYIVGTPIGNLNDISIRAINILKKVSFIACEDTRKTGKLLKHFKISNKLISCHKYNCRQRLDFLISKLREGCSIALVSDAGMPLISDPGEIIVSQARQNKFDVICIPGPCAAITGLVASGLDSSKFTFYGFLPKKGNDRDLILKSLAQSNNTSIIYESPKRILKLLLDLKKNCGGDRKILILKELTKKYEKHFGDNIDEVLEIIKSQDSKGEFTIVLSKSEKKVTNTDSINNKLTMELKSLINAGLSHSAASNYLSKKTGRPKNEIYRLII